MAKKNTNESKTDINPRMKIIGDKLRRLRVEAGHSSYETFAWDKGIGRMQYWRMERGSNFTFASLFKVLDAHGMSLADFFAEFTDVGLPKEEKE